MTSKLYRVIIADPPWQYNNKNVRGGAEKHYSTMSTDHICNMRIRDICHDDCILIMWANWPMLGDALRVIDAWGFTYKTGFPWVKLQKGAAIDESGNILAKPVWGTGWWIRSCSEPILVSIRGNIKHAEDPPLGLISERFEHSRKPDNLYQYAELWPGPYLELFARRARDGWDSFGNEVDNTISIGV